MGRELYGKWNSKLSVRSDGIEGRDIVHDWFWHAPTGMVVGTRGPHALSLAVASDARLTINPRGQVITKGHLFAEGGITMYWGPDKTWFNVQNYYNGIGWRSESQKRLAELRSEFEAGQRMLADLQARQAELQQTLLRLSGAIQVLEELLGPGEGDTGGNSATA